MGPSIARCVARPKLHGQNRRCLRRRGSSRSFPEKFRRKLLNGLMSPATLSGAPGLRIGWETAGQCRDRHPRMGLVTLPSGGERALIGPRGSWTALEDEMRYRKSVDGLLPAGASPHFGGVEMLGRQMPRGPTHARARGHGLERPSDWRTDQ